MPAEVQRFGLRAHVRLCAFLFLVAVFLPGTVAAQSLRGGVAAMREQHAQAVAHDFTFLKDPSQVNRIVEQGLLVPLKGNRDYRLDDEVSFPYARPEVRTFVERLSSQYRSACGEQLVVTSLTRPRSRQPRNSSPLSVHPTGMAVDLRRSSSRACRAWLEDVLLHLKARGTVGPIRERRPPHYHVAVFPKPYARYVAGLAAEERLAAEEPVVDDGLLPAVVRYQVRSGDSLWGIARAHGTTVDELKSANNIRGSRIYAGQLLEVPLGSR